MMKICPGTQPCAFTTGNTNYDCGGGNNRGARVSFNCPAGGQYTVFTANAASNRASTCNVQVRP
jgi:hypothetical protein